MVRGIAMVLMALDHVRDFLGSASANPTNLATTTVPLFLTRWMTHVCAPTFFLLTGLGAYRSQRGKPASETAWFLLTRGLWLIVLELVVVRFAMQFNVDYRVTFVTVIWALGWSMTALAPLVYLPPAAAAVAGIAMIAAHNLLDPIRSPNPFWIVVHAQGVIFSSGTRLVFSAYPLVPWMGVTAAGYALGQIYDWPAERRRRWLLATGAALIAAFFVVRAANAYGDPVRWSQRGTTAMTVVSFFNATKYPPSLVFLLMTLGPALLLLRAFDGRVGNAMQPAVVFGRVPLFYFLAHLAAIHLVAVVVCGLQYGAVHWMFESPTLAAYPITKLDGWGLSLPATYVIWLAIVASLYPLCRWYADVKGRSRSGWLRYL